VGEAQFNGVARWDGTTWLPLGSGLNGAVHATCESGSDLYVAGYFTKTGVSRPNEIRRPIPGSWDESRRSRVAKWDGTSWTIMRGKFDNKVCVLESHAGDLYAGGWFKKLDGKTVNHIVRWDGREWSSLGGGTDDSVLAIAFEDRDVYVGGSFRRAGGVRARGIGRWDGRSWSPLGNGVGGLETKFLRPDSDAGTVCSLLVHDKKLYVCGKFTVAGIQREISSLARWDGESWSGAKDVNGDDSARSTERVVHVLCGNGSAIYATGFEPTIWGYVVSCWDGKYWMVLASSPNRVDPKTGLLVTN
jgi:trimeric autotransporter adhesin